MSSRLYLRLIALTLLFPGIASAFEETDVATGKKKKVEAPVIDESKNDDLPEPVYLDEASRSEPSQIDESVVTGVMEKKAYAASRPIGGSVILGLSSHAFDLRLGVVYPWMQYLSAGFYLKYYSQQYREEKAYRFGPDASLIAHILIKNLIEPMIAFGVGYESWEARRDNERFDRGGTTLAYYAFGAQAHLTKHFALNLMRRTSYYANKGPMDVELSQRVSNPSHATEIGFVAKF